MEFKNFEGMIGPKKILKNYECSAEFEWPKTTATIPAENRNKAKYIFLRYYYPNLKGKEAFTKNVKIKLIDPEVSKLISENDLLKEEIETLKKENEEMKTSIRSEINEILECNEKLQAKNEALKAQVASILDSDEYTGGTRARIEKRVLEDKLFNQQKDLWKAQALIDDQKTTIDNLDSYSEEMKERVAAAHATIDDQKIEIRNLIFDYEKLNKLIGENEVYCEKIEKESNDLNRNFLETCKKHDNLVKRKDAEIEEYDQILFERENCIAALSKENYDLKKSLDSKFTLKNSIKNFFAKNKIDKSGV